MYSVSYVALNYKQPTGGFLSIREFKEEKFQDGLELHQKENIHSSIVGLAVDYLLRFNNTAEDINSYECFSISLHGAMMLDEEEKAEKLLEEIKGLDDISIINACKLSGYDCATRGMASYFKSVDTIEPDADTIENIRVMVKRSLKYFDDMGGIIKSGFTFDGAYTDIISCGDGDYLTKDTLYDLKVIKSKPTTKHTLQALIYYYMGKASIHTYYNDINKIGFFNPRTNTSFTYDMALFDKEKERELKENVIGFKEEVKVVKRWIYDSEHIKLLFDIVDTLNEIYSNYGVNEEAKAELYEMVRAQVISKNKIELIYNRKKDIFNINSKDFYTYINDLTNNKRLSFEEIEKEISHLNSDLMAVINELKNILDDGKKEKSKKILIPIVTVGITFAIGIGLGMTMIKKIESPKKEPVKNIETPKKEIASSFDIRADYEEKERQAHKILERGTGERIFYRYYNSLITTLKEYDISSLNNAKTVYELSDELLNDFYNWLKMYFTEEGKIELDKTQVPWVKNKIHYEETTKDSKLDKYKYLIKITLDKCQEWNDTYN